MIRKNSPQQNLSLEPGYGHAEPPNFTHSEQFISTPMLWEIFSLSVRCWHPLVSFINKRSWVESGSPLREYRISACQQYCNNLKRLRITFYFAAFRFIRLTLSPVYSRSVSAYPTFALYLFSSQSTLALACFD